MLLRQLTACLSAAASTLFQLPLIKRCWRAADYWWWWNWLFAWWTGGLGWQSAGCPGGLIGRLVCGPPLPRASNNDEGYKSYAKTLSELHYRNSFRLQVKKTHSW